MPLMKWTNHYSVGVVHMDDQHRTIFDIINDLFDALRKGMSSDVLAIVNRLIQYAQEHFSAEEQLLEEQNNPELARQRNEHLEFIQQVEVFKQMIAKGEIIEVESGLSKFLMSWWNKHILQEDKKYDPRR